MDQRERINDLELTLRMTQDGVRGRIWCALPAIVQSFDPVSMTCSVQVAIQFRQEFPDGSFQWFNMTPLTHCPVVFPGGGGLTLTFLPKQGDECLIVFIDRIKDNWWTHGGVQPQIDAQGNGEMRMHDLSDGFCIVGPRSKPRVLAAIADGAQLRTDDGFAYLQLDTSGSVSIQSPSVDVSDNLSVTNAASGTFTTQDGKLVTVANGIVVDIV